MERALRIAGLYFCCVLPTAASAQTMFADSSRGDLDTVPPVPGVLTAPPTAPLTGATVQYSGASDESGLLRVELWNRPSGGNWAFSGLADTGEAGSISFIPLGAGPVSFDLVAEDIVGNRSTQPAGGEGEGQATTIFQNDTFTNWMIY